jgi:hypothetical protein
MYIIFVPILLAWKAFPDFEVAVISPDNHILEIDRTAEEFAVIFMVPPSRSTTLPEIQ